VPIKIPFLSDVTDFIRGTDNMADALDDVSDSLDDLAKDSDKAADKAGDKLGDGFKDGAKSAGKAIDGMGDKLDGVAKDTRTLDSKVSAAFKNIATDAKNSGKKVGTSFKEGTEEAGEGVQTLGEEANSTAKESAASFDGSAESIIGSFQEVAANAFEGFGPAGQAAGLLMAVGIGMAVTKMQENADAINEAKEAVSSLAQEIDTMGGDLSKVDFNSKMREWGYAIQDTKEWFEVWQKDAKVGFQTIKDESAKAGTDWVGAFKAVNGPMEDAQRFLSDTADEYKRLGVAVEAGTILTARGEEALTKEGKAARDKLDALDDQRDAAEKNINTQKDAIAIAKDATLVAGKSSEAIEAETQALLGKADAMDKASGRAKDADQAQLDYIETVNQSTKDIEANGKQTDINTDAGRANRKTLLDLADSSNVLIGAQIEQGDSTKNVTVQTQKARDSFVAAATAAGFTKDQAEALATKYGLIPKNVDTKVQAHNVQETKNQIDDVAKPRTVPISLAPDGSEVERFIQGMNGKTIHVALAPRSGSGITY
jgi:hypothetical protein